ncbi:MAG: TIGR01212 family radical SAM protein [Caldimicrobium sp.]
MSLNKFLREKFGEKVKKIPLDAGFTCPNRDGTKGSGGCIYCDAKGSGTGLNSALTLKEQIQYFISKFAQRGYKKFIAYFQSFSNTYAPKEKLEEVYSTIFDFPEIVGIAIGTRPDCINSEVIKVLKYFQSLGYFLWVELGLQSIHNETLKRINRGHSYEEFIEAYRLLKENNISLCIHLIFGLPGEDKEMMLETVKSVATLQPDGVKFHALYIVKNAPIAKLYENQYIKLLTLEEYADLVATSLAMLPPYTVVHRLTSDPPKESLIAPLWLLEKNRVLQSIQQIMKEKGLYQGKNFLVDPIHCHS